MNTATARSTTFLVFATLAAATGLMLSATPAHADQDHVATSVEINYADLDLNTPKDVKVLYLRLKDAAANACGDDASFMGLAERDALLKCEQVAIEKAVEQIDRPRLTARYDRNFPRDPALVAARVS
ncbi:MAG: UrcA family protein [Gammaproteobacteria bacterium]